MTETQQEYRANSAPPKDDPFQMELFGLAMEIHNYDATLSLLRKKIESMEAKRKELVAEFDRRTGIVERKTE